MIKLELKYLLIFNVCKTEAIIINADKDINI